MNKVIWIINEYAGSPYHGMEFRHYYLSKEFIRLGYTPIIITASYSHLFKQIPAVKDRFTFQNIDGIQYVWIKVPSYPESHSKKRVLKWFIFTLSLYNLPFHKLPVPQYIILSPMQTMPIYPALKWAKKFKSKLIFEVKDIWPLSIMELGGYSDNHLFIKWLKHCEKTAIQKSDAIVSVLPNYDQYLKKNGWNKPFYYIPNGVKIENYSATDELEKSIESQIPQNKFIVGYTGTLGTANAMHYLIEAARILKNEHAIHFVIIGEGSEKEKLIQQAKDLNNVSILPSIPKKQIQIVLQKVDVCYIGLENKALFQYGVSPNKLFDYMLAEKPILFSVNAPNNPVEKAACGIIVPPASPEAIADAIKSFYTMPADKRFELGKKAKQFVLQNHAFEILAQKYDELLNTCYSGRQ